MKITSLLLIMFFLCVPTGAQSLDLGGLLNSAIQEAVKNAGQPAPARQPQNSVLPQQGDAPVRDRQSSSSVMPNQTNNQSSSQGNISSSSNESSSPEIKVVEVEGVGENQSKAKEDAYRNAVEKAVGSFVSADLVAKNDQLIKDEVLNYSVGYIEKSEVISEGKRPDGLYSIKLRASVVKKKLTRQLEALNIATADVDSESIFAEAVTTSNQRESAQKIWAKLFEDFWSKAFEVEVSGKPQLAYGPDDNVQAYFKVVVRFNEQFLQELENTMRATGSSLRTYQRPENINPIKSGFSSACSFTVDYYNYHGDLITNNLSDYQFDFVYQNNRFGEDNAFIPISLARSPTPLHKYWGKELSRPRDDPSFINKNYLGFCVDIPINLDKWSFPKEKGFYNFHDIQQKGEPHVLLTLGSSEANKDVASAVGVLVAGTNMRWNDFGGFVGYRRNEVTFTKNYADVRYISVSLKRNQLQDISKVEVRAAGKLIYDCNVRQ